MQILDIVEGTTVDGPGLRTSIYVAGCRHKCEGCHNPQSWDFNAGNAMTDDDILEVINRNGFNVTLSGGDPMYHPEDVARLCRRIKLELHKNIWLYTGFRWEDICDKPEYAEILSHIDVIVDGPFILSRRDISLRFRGSGNQRIIDVQKSLSQDKIVLYE